MALSKQTGWIYLSRKMMKNSMYLSQKFTDGHAWIDLIFLAMFKEGMINVAGKRIKIERGQVGYSQKSLAERWKWSRSKVKRFLNYLENEHMIEQVNVQLDKRLKAIISITNYDQYQPQGQVNEQEDEHQTNTSRTSNGTVLKKDKELKENTTNNALSSSPRKTTRKKAMPVRDNPPSQQEIEDYCNEQEFLQIYLDLNKFWNYYVTDQDGQWQDRDGKDLLNWKQKLRQWHERGRKDAGTNNNYVQDGKPRRLSEGEEGYLKQPKL